MKILLIGASGFIGSAVRKLLDESQHQVILTSRRMRPGFIRLDAADPLRTRDTLKEIAPDVVLNFSWNTTGDDYLESRQNLDSLTWNLSLFKILNEISLRKIISLGSSAEYESRPVLQGENVLAQSGDSLYADSKIQAFKLLTKMSENSEHSFTWARIFQAYGEGQSNQRLIPSLLRYVRSQEIFYLRQPNTYLDWINVLDIAKSLAFLIENDSPLQVDIGTGKPTSNQQLCSLFSKHLGLRFEITTDALTQQSFRLANTESSLYKESPPQIDLESYISGLQK